ncbi:MAG TPA: hypothetical protein VKM93_28660 [Terriglobia bacterium]|nr:hypothetical protein [Terriglobia bacterium]
MTLTLELKDRVQTELAARAQVHGLPIEAYVEKLLEQAVENEQRAWDQFGSGARSPEESGRDILELRRGVTLGGLRIKDLIHEGHRY